ncbi:MAG: HAMP domain-containing histidine kinase [Gemmatimonadaceae bacterium]|nr:HAMP domain-containing histidine kinase [Gemmatimonadaceae bacterium]
MTRFGFRTRLLLVLIAFAVLPAIAVGAAWAWAASEAFSMVASEDGWQRLATTGDRALTAARAGARSPGQRAALDAHERELRATLEQAARLDYLAPRLIRPVLLGVGIVFVLVTVLASKAAGHFSRQLSRPLDDIVGWTERIARDDPLPDGPPPKGAPEFDVLRSRMRTMATQLAAGRRAATEAARLAAFRETARRVAHELKNPLTPISFAVSALRRTASPAQHDALEVLDVETRRLETLAKSFAQFGRLPDGPAHDVDVAELLRYAARTTLGPDAPVTVDVPDGLPMVRGHHDALARAMANLLLNANDAIASAANGAGGAITITARADDTATPAAVRIAVADTGCGMTPDVLARIWEPYVTSKPGGTGLGLAIVKQAVDAHGGAVHAASTPGTGTTITLTLPVAQATGSAA